MFGSGIFKGFAITLKHLVMSYWEDFTWRGRRYFRPEGIARRSGKDARGIFTIQYPEERLPVPEAFRMFPVLVYSGADGEQRLLCIACGICARICPPQCIWIVRSRDSRTGKPVAAPEQFLVDIDRCMNCGYCAEYCPHGAIRMDKEFELADRNRSGHVYNLKELRKPASRPAEMPEAVSAREPDERRRRKSTRKGEG
jgi:NADH-quinone oxidoreductase subunit I